MIKVIFLTITGLLFVKTSHSQFTLIPTGTTTDIYEMQLHGDTLIILGQPNYFGKYCTYTGDWTVLSSPGFSSYENSNLQIVNNDYYLLSSQGFPYDHNYILKSSNFGASWDTIFHTPGLFYTMSIADSTFGILGGAFGSHAITDGSDTSWVLQDSLNGGVFMSSAVYGDSIAMLEGTDKSYLSDNRDLTWADWLAAPLGSPQETQFLSEDTIFSISNYGSSGEATYFRRTTDGGSTWNNIAPCSINSSNYECNATLYQMKMKHDGTGIILAYVENIMDNWDGEIIQKTCFFKTTDFGSTWSSYVTDIPEEMYCMSFLNDSTAFIAGENGLLYKWDLTQPFTNVLGEEQNGNDFALTIYPNPANEFIKLEGDYLKHATYELFSLSGQLVRTGKIELNQINVSAIEKGQYILQITTENFTYREKVNIN